MERPAFGAEKSDSGWIELGFDLEELAFDAMEPALDPEGPAVERKEHSSGTTGPILAATALISFSVGSMLGCPP